ncbi:Stealth CR1 domain-containing protein, partial [Loktanella sp. DJP18]
MIKTIDAVITWVDGNDPMHLSKRERFQDPSAHP